MAHLLTEDSVVSFRPLAAVGAPARKSPPPPRPNAPTSRRRVDRSARCTGTAFARCPSGSCPCPRSGTEESMESLQPFAPALALAGSVLGVVAVVGWLTLQSRFQRFARPYEELSQTVEKDGVAAALQAHLLG